jgi:hypothetical protein
MKYAGFGDFRARVSFRKTARVPQFCGLFVLIGTGRDKQMSDEIATLSIQRPCSTPVAALRATEKRSFPTSLNAHEQSSGSPV